MPKPLQIATRGYYLSTALPSFAYRPPPFTYLNLENAAAQETLAGTLTGPNLTEPDLLRFLNHIIPQIFSLSTAILLFFVPLGLRGELPLAWHPENSPESPRPHAPN